jgi:signal transduction histidine kinase
MGLWLRVVLLLTLPAVLLVGAHGFLRMRREAAQLQAEDRQNMAVTARAIQIAVENALRDRQISDVRRLIAEMVEQQDLIDRIRLFDRRLQPTLVSNALAIGEAVPGELLQRVLATGAPDAFYERRAGQSVLYYLAPVRGRTGAIEGAMEIAHVASGIDRRLAAATRDTWIRLSLLALAIVLTSTLVVQRQVLQPLARLMEGIRRLGQGQPGPPLPVERRDELGRVAEAFNEMAARLGQAQARLLAEGERTLELEQQLRRAATLAVAGKLASGLAHEVGTPLNIISGRAEVLLKETRPGEQRRQDLEIIIGQIDRISRIITSLLDTVRPHKPEVQPTHLDEVLDHLLPLLRHAARRRGVRLTTDVRDDLGALEADPGQLQQVLINLVVNALEATPAGGRVAVNAQPAARDGRPGAALAVQDTGSGIPDEIRPRLFEPFFTTKPRGQGTGLGLAICRDIIRAHGGEIEVTSQPGRGSTFTVWLPVAAAVRE